MQVMRETLYDETEIEYLDGQAVPKVSPRARHGAVQHAMVRVLDACAGSRGFVATEWRFYPGGRKRTSLIPDVSFVSRERLAALTPEERQTPPFSPDIAVEVRSPSEPLPFLQKKIARYLATGAVIVLDVDPAARTIETHSAHGVQRHCAGARFVCDAIAWLAFDVDSVFADLDEFGL